MVCGLFSGTALAIRSKTPFEQKEIELSNTSPWAIELNPSCSGQVYYNRLGTCHKNESTEPGFNFIELRVLSMIRPLAQWMPCSASLFSNFCVADTNERLDFSLFRKPFVDPLKRP